MLNTFLSLPLYIQAFLSGLFTFLITSIGASLVFLFKKENKFTFDIFLSLSAGVMLGSTFFSLLIPAINTADNLGFKPWLIVSISFLCGALLLFLGNKILNNKYNNHKNSIFLFSITLHNIPEGLAIGVAFGSLLFNINESSNMSALMLALGIGIQNFPEGSSVSIPLKRSGLSSNKAFFLGSITAIVEPLSALIGALLAIKINIILPFLLAFAAGAMIYVIFYELIPSGQNSEKKDLMTLFTIIGFIMMMIFDLGLS